MYLILKWYQKTIHDLNVMRKVNIKWLLFNIKRTIDDSQMMSSTTLLILIWNKGIKQDPYVITKNACMIFISYQGKKPWSLYEIKWIIHDLHRIPHQWYTSLIWYQRDHANFLYNPANQAWSSNSINITFRILKKYSWKHAWSWNGMNGITHDSKTDI